MSLQLFRRRRGPWRRALLVDALELASVMAALALIALIAGLAGVTFHL